MAFLTVNEVNPPNGRPHFAQYDEKKDKLKLFSVKIKTKIKT